MFKSVPGREFWIRFLLVSLPFLLLVLIEISLVIADRSDPPTDADDLKARKLMKASWGSVRKDDMALFTPSHDPIFKINKVGFRTHELDAPRGGETRIVLLGGSTAFGWGVADRHGIDKYLEKILGVRAHLPVKVFNLSIPAVGFSVENRVLELYGPQIEPDIVVFYHGANDGLAWYQQTIGKTQSRQSLTPPFFSTDMLVHLAYKSRIFRLAMEAVRSGSKTLVTADIDVREAIEDYTTRFDESVPHCESIKCVYIIQPVIFDKAQRTTREIKLAWLAGLQFPLYEQMYAKYADAVMARSFANHYDARRVLSKARDDIFLDYVHVTGTGNRVLALFIANTLCAGQFILCK